MRFCRKIYCVCALSLCFFSCAKKNIEITVPNKDKPVIFFNRQPGDAITGKVDTAALNHNADTFFVGSDAAGGGAMQGALVADFLLGSDANKIDRNGDGIIGYLLLIGSDVQIDADYRTQGMRKALGTWNGSSKARDVKIGSIKISNKAYQIEELDSKVMKDKTGSSWNTKMASESMAFWLWKYKDKIDMVISNNDSMALACINTKGFPKGIPVFGYDANEAALDAIEKGEMAGSISQSFDYQAAMTMLMMRSLVDGVAGEDSVGNGISVPDKYGNQINQFASYDRFNRSILVQNAAVTKENVSLFKKSFKHINGIKEIEREDTEKKILMTVYNENSYFTAQQLVPAMKYYAQALNLSLTIINGNGRNDACILQQIENVDEYDGFLLNLVSTNQARSYLERIR